MKILVISDTHGRLNKVLEIYKRLKDIDMIIHLGDYEKDGMRLSSELGIDVIAVKGNMDGGGYDDYEILDTEYGKLLLVHGHIQNVKHTLMNIKYFAEEKECRAALFGHTHLPVFEESEGIYLINPGSLSLPADGSQGSYAIVNTKKDELTGSIVYYHELPAVTGKKPKVQGGFLRDLLNNSDRF